MGKMLFINANRRLAIGKNIYFYLKIHPGRASENGIFARFMKNGDLFYGNFILTVSTETIQ